MRISWRMLATIAVLGLWSGPRERWVLGQSHPAASELIQKLQSDKTTDDARKRLLRLGKSDPDIRRYLVASLPPMIEMGPKSCPPSEIVDVFARWHTCPWYNAVELAGELKIGEAAPALAPWIGWRTPAPFILSLEARLVFYPAAKALAEIGDPAIPVVQPALDRGNSDEHYKAVRVLCIIHTPNAKAVLRDDLQRETDPDLQAMIRNALRK